MQIDPYNGTKQHVIASLISKNAAKTIDFYKDAFDAKVNVMANYDDKIAHSEIVIGGTLLMISDEMYGAMAKSATTIGDTPVTFYYYVDDVDDVFDRAVKLGAKVTFPVHDEFYGDRVGAIVDPFGFKWTIATHIKEVNPAEMQAGLADMMEKKDGGNGDYYKKKYIKYKTKYLDKLLT